MTTDYIAVTSAHNWGRGKTVREALSNAYAKKGHKVTLYALPESIFDNWEVSHMDGSVTAFFSKDLESLSRELRQSIYDACISRWTVGPATRLEPLN